MKKQIFIIMLIVFSLVFWKVIKQEDMKEKVLSSKNMIKIKGEGQWVGYRCHTSHSEKCGEVSDPCIPGTGSGLPCTRCSGTYPVNWCVEGICSDVCYWNVIECGLVIDGNCNFTGQCVGSTIPGSECNEYDCY